MMTSTELESERKRLRKSKTGRVVEIERCASDALYFFTHHVRVEDKINGRVILWEPYSYLVSILRDLGKYRELLIAKARQQGLSWTIAGAYAFWTAIFRGHTRVLEISKGQREAEDLIAKCKFIHSNIDQSVLPLPKIGTDSKQTLEFPSIHSDIMALPSTKDAGRSTDASLVIRDEADFHEFDEENYGAVKPVVARGGQLIQMTTRGEDDNSHFLEMWKKGKAGLINAHCIFVGWRSRPLSDSKYATQDDWFNEEIKKSGLKDYQIEREYPENEIDFLKPSKTRAYFDHNILDLMLNDVMVPLLHEMSDKYPTVHIFKMPEPHLRYCCFADPSDGKEDPHAIVVIDVQTGEEVANSHGKTPVTLAAKIFDELVRMYNNAYNTFALTGFSGKGFQVVIEELKTPNAHRQAKDRLGFWESGHAKHDMLCILDSAISARSIRIHYRDAIEEMRQIRVSEGESEPSTPRKAHDDLVTAWAGVTYIRKFVPHNTQGLVSFHYKDG